MKNVGNRHPAEPEVLRKKTRRERCSRISQLELSLHLQNLTSCLSVYAILFSNIFKNECSIETGHANTIAFWSKKCNPVDGECFILSHGFCARPFQNHFCARDKIYSGGMLRNILIRSVTMCPSRTSPSFIQELYVFQRLSGAFCHGKLFAYI